MLAGFLPRLASLVSQPAVLAAGVATGVAVGAVGVGTGAIPVTDPGPRLTALFECPDAGRVVKNLPSSQSVLVTARSADGAWLQIYLGEPGAERAWARATSLQMKAAPDSLPVADCTPAATPEQSLERPTGLPSPASTEGPPTGVPTGVPQTARPSTPTPLPSPTRTPAPTKTPKPTPTPLTGPVLSNATLYAPAQEDDGIYRVYYRDLLMCPYAWNNVGLTVEASDSQGIASVTLYHQPTNGSVQSVGMADEDGFGTLWDGGFDAQESWLVGPLHVWLQGTDGDGNKGPILDLDDSAYELAVGTCITKP